MRFWANTTGGHRRYSEKELLAILGPYAARRSNRCAVAALDGPAGERALAEQLQMLRKKPAAGSTASNM